MYKNLPTADDIIKRSKIHHLKVKCIYLFGSKLYFSCNQNLLNKNSDWDFIVVANTSISNQEIRSGDFNIHIITPDQFQTNLSNHKIQMLECYFAPSWAKILEDRNWEFKLDMSRLRHSISHVSSNSWVKCKKKIAQGDYYIGLKSIFHSIRIPMFGIQIAKFGKIVDFSCANKIWEDMSKENWTWTQLDNRYRELQHSVLSELRRYASK